MTLDTIINLHLNEMSGGLLWWRKISNENEGLRIL